MSWRVSVSFAGAVLAGVTTAGTPSARADEAYLCGPDKVVYVAVKDLEEKKRTDPCIAAYYGLKVEAPAAQTAVAPAPADKPAAAAARPRAADLKALSDSEVPERVARAERRHAALDLPRAMPGTDYRRVRVLNAAEPASAFYYHAK